MNKETKIIFDTEGTERDGRYPMGLPVKED